MNRSAQHRLTAIVSMLAFAMLSTACSRVTEAIAPTATTTPSASASGEARVATGGSVASVDFATYEAAVNQLVTCMEDAGAPITDPVLDPSSGLFVYDYDASNELVYETCHASTIAEIDAAYRLDPSGPPEDQLAGPVGDFSELPEGSWVRLLSRIPDSTDTRFSPVTVIDLERARTHFEIDLPAEADDDRLVLDYLGTLAGDAGIVPAGPLAAFGRSAYPDQIRGELGFDHRSFDRLASAGSGAKELTIAEGRFDPVAIDGAVTSDPIWSPVHALETHENVTFHTWGIDFELDLDRFTPTRTVGHHRRLAVDDERLVWARWTQGIHEAIDTETGTRHSLADHEELQTLALIADDLDLYTGLLTASVAPLVGSIDQQRVSVYTLTRPESVLLGDGADEDGRFTAIVLNYGTTAGADAQLTDFEGRIAELAATSVEGETFRTMAEARTFEITQIAGLLVGQIWLDDNAVLPSALDLITFR